MLRSWRLVGIAITLAIVCGVLGVLQRREPVEGVDRSEPGVAGSRAVAPVVFEVVEERADQRRVEIVEVQLERLLAGLLVREAQQQPERVAVGGDRLRAGVALGDQTVGEERLERGRERGHESTSRQLLQAAADQLEQLGDRLQIPICAGRVDMPEERGEQRHPPVDVLAGLIPVKQRVHGQGMAEIVRAGSGASAAAVQADLADQLGERLVELLRGIRRPRAAMKNAGVEGSGKRASRSRA